MKTVKDAIMAYPGVADGEEFLSVVLTDRGMDGDAVYTAEAGRDVRLAVADVYAMIGGLPNFTEYKLSVSYDRAWYRSKAAELYRENGEAEKANRLGGIFVPRGKSNQTW